MRSLLLTITSVFTLAVAASAQISITPDNSAPDSSAMLDIKSTSKGVLVPRMTTAQRTVISNPATGLLVFDTDTGGFWFYNGTSWTNLSGDNLGDHTATQDLDMAGHSLDNADTINAGYLGLGTPASAYHVDAKDSIRLLSGVKDVVFTWGHYGPSSDQATELYFNRNDVGFNQSEFVLYNSNYNPESDRYFQLQYTGDSSGLTIRKGGNIGIGTLFPDAKLEVIGNVVADSFIGDGSELTNVPGDNLGNHTATDDINLDGNWLIGGTSGTGINIDNHGSVLMQNNALSDVGLELRGSNGVTMRFHSDTTEGNPDYQWTMGYIEGGFEINDYTGGSTPFSITPGSANGAFRISGNNVGIGIAPTNTLDVNGQIRMRSGASEGYVPVSDANGVMQWMSPDALNVPGDNLGNHTATDTLRLDGNMITNGGGTTFGISLDSAGTLHSRINDSMYITPNLELESVAHFPTIRFNRDTLSWDIGTINDYFTFRDRGNGTAPFTVQGGQTDNVLVLRSNNVGIQTSNPTRPLDVNGKIRMRDGAHFGYIPISANDGTMTWTNPSDISIPGDNLGDHIATMPLDMDNNDIFNGGDVHATAFYGDGSHLTNIAVSGDNLGDHTATANLQMNGHWISNDGDDEGLYVDTTGNVGVGTSTPDAKLNVSATGDSTRIFELSTERAWAFEQEGMGSNSNLRFRNVVGLNKRLFFDTDGATAFRTHDGSATAVFIDHSNAKLGIGTDAPESALEVTGDAQLTNDDPMILFKDESGTNGNRQSEIRTTLVSQLGSDGPEYQVMSFHVSNGSNTGTNQVMTLVGNGSVGVNTNAPSTTLDVNGSVRIRGGSPAAGDILSATDSDGNASWVDPKDKVVNVYSGSASHDDTDSYWDVVTTPALTVKTGDLVVIYATAQGAMSGGTGSDPFDVNIRVSGCSTTDLNVRTFTPPEDGASHDNPIAMPALDTYVATCDGTVTFSYRVRNTGDDAYDVLDATVVAIKQ